MKSAAALASAMRRTVGAGMYPGQFVLAENLGRVLAKLQNPVEGRIGEYRVQLDLTDRLQRQMFFGIYDRALTAFISSRLRPGDVFYDIGANVGYYSLLASSLVGPNGSVHAFEPIQANVDSLRGNAVDNITINQVAIGDAIGSLTLFVSERPESSGWASIVPSEKRTKRVDVPVLTIDHYIETMGNPVPGLVKIDIEGAEPAALTGMRALLHSDSAPDLIVEINTFLLDRDGQGPDAIIEPLLDAGYRLYEIRSSGLEGYEPPTAERPLIDVFATKRPQVAGVS